MANAKVEVAVQIAQRWIVARLRNRRFNSLAELNAAIRELVDQLNNRVTRHLGASRRQLFDQIEKAALGPLPAAPYEFAEWKQRAVGLDYHVEVEKHYYSVPHGLLREKLWVRITARSVEIFHKGARVAVHIRTSGNRQHTTLRDHMPSSHRHYAEWTPEKIRSRAAEIGPHTAALIEAILRARRHPEQGFRSCLGILRLVKSYGRDQLEAACERAIESERMSATGSSECANARSYKSVNSILKNNLHRKRPEKAADGPAITHPNIRRTRGARPAQRWIFSLKKGRTQCSTTQPLINSGSSSSTAWRRLSPSCALRTASH